MWDKVIDGSFKFLEQVLGADNAVLAIVLIFILAICIMTGAASGVIWKIYQQLIKSFDMSNQRLADVNENLMKHHQEKTELMISSHTDQMKGLIEEHRIERQGCEQRYEEVRDECKTLRQEATNLHMEVKSQLKEALDKVLQSR